MRALDSKMSKRKHFKTVEAPDDTTGFVTDVPALRPSITKEFLLSGRAFFRVSNRQGMSFTYKVHAREGLGAYAGEPAYFVRVQLINSVGWRYVGVLLDDGTLKATGRSGGFIKGSPEFDVACWALRVVFTGQGLPEGYKIEHIGKCGKCARSLFDPQGGIPFNSEALETGLHVGCRV